MSALDELLASDTANVGNSQKAFFGFDQGLPTAFDTAAEMFITFIRCMERSMDESEEREILCRCAAELGVTHDELIEKVETAGGSGDSGVLARARKAYVRVRTRRAQLIIFLLLQRHYLWGVTDLLRMRVTPAEGYRRLEAEAVGLLILIRDEPSLGDSWLKIRTVDEGRQFFNLTQAKLRETLRSLNLDSAYEQGSGVAQHVRVASAVLGLSWSEEQARLACQEVRTDDPFSYFLGTLAFLVTQVHVFHALTVAFPHVTDPIWHTRVELFHNQVARLWKRLEERFPDECKAAGEGE